METTPLYELESIPYGVIDWTAILNRNFTKIDNAIHSHILITAGEALGVRNLIYMKSDGLWYKAKADGTTTQPALAMCRAAVAVGAQSRALRHGYTGLFYSLLPGQLIYLSTTTLGSYTQTKPASNIQVVGFALTEDTAFMNFTGVIL